MEGNAYNFEERMKSQEQSQGTVEKSAIDLAKENMAKKKLEEDARQAEQRLRSAERTEEKAVKEGRFASKKKNIMKTYSEAIVAAKAKFESSGNWEAYDKEAREAEETKDKALREAANSVFGEIEAWRYLRD